MSTSLQGTWFLKNYTFVKDSKTFSHDDINGLLIYAADGWVRAQN